ncbi:MAG TPA: SMC family ATPase [Nitrososphaerales archaeon]|nr:SMC family ATPase [Nitrososphaerales archaeon]
MLVRSVTLRNIRSYSDGEEVKVDLPEGIVLFEGDIGSGKSTLLYALEFALFGFSDMKGEHLLSEGKKEGRVSVVIEAGGKEYTIERRLRARGDDVSQDDCIIKGDGTMERLSPSDLKERVVSILGFNEPTHPRAESLVYRYAVFTPQEQMKEILTRNPEDRLHVIRRVLGAQSYQVASENSTLIERRLSKMAYGLRKASEDLADKKQELKLLSETESHLRSTIPRLESDAKAAEKKVAELEDQRKEELKKQDALSRLAGRIEPLRESVEELQKLIEGNKEEMGRLETELATDVVPIIKRFESVDKPKLTVRELTSRSNSLGRKLAGLEASKETLASEAAKTQELVSKGVCPTCGQPLPHDFSRRSEHVEVEIKKLHKEIEAISAEASATTTMLEEAVEYDELEKDYVRAAKERARTHREIESLSRKIDAAEDRLKTQRAELSKAEAKGGDLDSLLKQIEAVESELRTTRTSERSARDKLRTAQAEMADAAAAIERLSAELAKKEKDAAEAHKLANHEDWLAGFFRPTVEQIERQALTEAAARFNEHFQRFFTTLVDDPDMVVRVREDFSPVFEREGYDQDYEALSGGERTSMALAYRFALNAVIRDSMSSQPELVVLDEPTDGFSKEQVYKMRSLLEELDSRQVIMVSHEKELESMADHIFRVEKVNGASRVSKMSP